MVSVLVLVFLLLFLPVLVFPWKVEVSYKRRGHDDELVVATMLLMIGKIVIRIPMVIWRKSGLQGKIDLEAGQQERELSEQDVFLSVSRLARLAGRFMKPVGVRSLIRPLFRQIEFFAWHSKVGTGNAASTATALGGMWALEGTVASFLTQKAPRLAAPEISVTPDFNRRGLDTDLLCILRFWPVHIILTGLYHFLYNVFMKGVQAVGKRQRWFFQSHPSD